MKASKFLLTPLVFFFFLIRDVYAHCPLCTVGAAVAAGGAAWIGVDAAVIGLFIGAFSVSMGWWFSRIIKKKIIPFQKAVIILIMFLTIVIPTMPLINGSIPFYINLIGDYGSILNRTYIINSYLLGGIIGGLIVSLSPYLSKRITKHRNSTIPYQGVSLTLILLVIVGITLQVLI